MPKISIILTSYNHAKYIREAIDSVLNQTFTDFELIILDDASSDDSWKVINQYSDLRINAIRSERQGELQHMTNNAIAEVAMGEYIAIHHSDDVWDPGKLEKQVSVLEEHYEIGAVFTNVLAINEYGTPLVDKEHFYFTIFSQTNRSRHEWLRLFIIRGNVLCHPSVLIRKECYRECGFYRNYLPQVGDFDMWIRVCLKYEIYVLPDQLVQFRVLNNEANASGTRPETKIRRTYEFYKLLPNYRQISNFDDLVRIFPEAEKYYRNNETDMDFALAMAILELRSFQFTQLFAQDILFEIISDTRRAENIKRLYKFDNKNFIELTGQNDVFSVLKVAEQNAKVNEIYASSSWKITRPLRYLMQFFNKNSSR